MSTASKDPGKTAASVPPPTFTPVGRPLLQRQCACGASTTGMECGACANKRLLQRRGADDADRAPMYAPAVVQEALRTDGQPLDPTTRAEMESRFHYDFRRVRVHADASAAASARAVNALAFTVGDDIVFAPGQYQPNTAGGRRLLAHELAHTIQQEGVGHATGRIPFDEARGAALESEADRAASLVAHPMPGQSAGASVLTRVGEPLLSRATDDDALEWESLPSADKKDLKALDITEQSRILEADDDAPVQAFRLPSFPLPGNKGPGAEAKWRELARVDRLRAFIGFKPSKKSSSKVVPYTSLKQERTKTTGLRENWLAKIHWGEDEAAKNWEDAGGDKCPTKVFEPKVGKATCDMDHIVELQVGGTNLPHNVQVLDAGPNRSSGSTIANYLATTADKIRKVRPKLATVVLHFDDVEVTGAKAPCKAGTCCAIEQDVGDVKQKKPKATADRRPYPITDVTAKTYLMVPTAFGKGKKAESHPIYADDENKVSAELISGLLLRTLETTGKKDHIVADVDADLVADETTGKKRKSRVPLTLSKGASIALDVDTAKNGQLSISKNDRTPNLEFTFPHLSKGKITKLLLDEKGSLSGTGVLKPDIPLLKNTTVALDFGPDRLEAKADIDAKKLAVPIPGVRVTEAKVGLLLHPEFKPSGTIGIAVGPAKKPYLAGTLNVSADADGFVATSDDVRVNIPGINEGKGTVTYRKKKGWSGSFHVSTSTMKGVKSASVDGTVDEKGLVVTGAIKLFVPPKGPEVDLGLHYDRDKITYTGSTTLDVPRLKSVKLDFAYDGEHVTASGETAFAFKSLTGEMKVKYREGVISGAADLKIVKNKLNGSLHVELLPSQKFTGKGVVTFEVREGLLATGGIEIDKDERVALTGALEITKPIKLFDGFHGKKDLFTLPTLSIPVPGASIGPVGLTIQIEAAAGCEYGIGPGQITKAKILAKLNPLEENPDIEATAEARAEIPMHAAISASVTGAIAIDVKLGSVSGGLRATAIADLGGGVYGQVTMHFAKGHFTLDAVALINAALMLILKLEAVARARAGIGSFSIGTEKTWDLAQYKYDTGLQFTVSAPLHYDSREAFKPPSFESIKFSPMKLDTEDLLKKTMAGKGEEKKA